MGNTSATGGYLRPTSPDVINDAALEDVFTEAVAGITGLDGRYVRPKWQDKPPKRPASSVDWVALGITETTPDDGPVIRHDPNGAGGLGESHYSRHKDITVLATFYGPNAKGFAELLGDGICIPQNLEELQKNSISFVSVGTIRAVPESVNMQWIIRYDLLLYFRRAVTRAYAIQTIETAGVELHVCDKVIPVTVP